ncbi:MAG: 3-dehydroquinate synthase, partial [Clostridia bacterium]|nr:3-dehydroquinate synthase [Clostridia bacterium]
GEEIAAVHAPCRAAVVTDSNVAPLYADRVETALRAAGFDFDLTVIPAGEEHKNIESFYLIQRHWAQIGLTRSDLAVALGGGVIGDLCGFSAAAYQRGIPFVQAPTTLLSAVDASVGGKTAIDLPEGKNMVGAFHQPLRVLCDTSAFSTLPEARWQDGAAEMIKHAVIADQALFTLMASGAWRGKTEDAVAQNVNIKRSFVVGDEKDKGKRQLLNFGHTIGHAIEHLSGYKLMHGQGVAIGMACETRAARKMGLTSLHESEIMEALSQNGLPVSTDFPVEEIIRVVSHDKKRQNRYISVIVPEKIGAARLHQLAPDEIRDYVTLGISA